METPHAQPLESLWCLPSGQENERRELIGSVRLLPPIAEEIEENKQRLCLEGISLSLLGKLTPDSPHFASTVTTIEPAVRLGVAPGQALSVPAIDALIGAGFDIAGCSASGTLKTVHAGSTLSNAQDTK